MRRFFAIAIIGSVFLCGGCASKYGEQQTQVNYYPACYRPIQDLRGGENTVAKNTAGGALLGAFGGAMIGLLTTGKWQGAVMGAATGGVAGTMIGNMYGRKQQERDDNIRLASYLQDIDGDISNLDVTSAAARTSLQCYDREFQALLGEIRTRRISREAAAARFAEISNGRQEAIAILGNAAEYGRNINQEYENALASEEQNLKTPAKAKTVAYQQNVNTINKARQRKTAITQKTTAITRDRQKAIDDSAAQTRQINEAMAALENIKA